MLKLLEGAYPKTADEYKEHAKAANVLAATVRNATDNLYSLLNADKYLRIRLQALDYTRYSDNTNEFETWKVRNANFSNPIALAFHIVYKEPKKAPTTIKPVLRRVLEAWDYKENTTSKKWSWKNKGGAAYGPPSLSVGTNGVVSTGYYGGKIRTGIALDQNIRRFISGYQYRHDPSCSIDKAGKLVIAPSIPRYSYGVQPPIGPPAPITLATFLQLLPKASDVWKTEWETTTWPTFDTIQTAIKQRTYNPTPYSIKKVIRTKYMEKIMADPATIGVAIQKRAWICRICGAVAGTDPTKRMGRHRYGHEWVSLNRTRAKDLETIYTLQQAGCLHKN